MNEKKDGWFPFGRTQTAQRAERIRSQLLELYHKHGSIRSVAYADIDTNCFKQIATPSNVSCLLDLIRDLEEENELLHDLVERIKMEAQIHAQEARIQRHTVRRVIQEGRPGMADYEDVPGMVAELRKRAEGRLDAAMHNMEVGLGERERAFEFEERLTVIRHWAQKLEASGARITDEEVRLAMELNYRYCPKCDGKMVLDEDTWICHHCPSPEPQKAEEK